MIDRAAAGGSTGSPRTRPPRSRPVLFALGTLVALLVVALLVLGTWQVRRLAWKEALIARVDARVRAAPVAAPGPVAWPTLTADAAEYRRVQVRGRWLGPGIRTQAATALGSGSWWMMPLRTDSGFTVLVNRGFVPTRWQAPPADTRPVALVGLLRFTEPGGGFLRRNDPAAGRWHSRDVSAIAAANRLGVVAPYFIDAAADPAAPGRPPVGGLTVIAFANNHLVYAITWYALAAMLAGGWGMILRYERRLR